MTDGELLLRQVRENTIREILLILKDSKALDEAIRIVEGMLNAPK